MHATYNAGIKPADKAFEEIQLRQAGRFQYERQKRTDNSQRG